MGEDLIGALFIRLGTDVTGLQEGIGPGGKADKELDGFTNRVNAGILKVGAILAGLGVSIATGLYAAYQHTEELGQSAYDMGEKFGLSGGEASKWLAIAGLLGLSAETVGTGLKFLDRNMGDAADAIAAGHKPAEKFVDALKSIGVSIFDVHGKLKSSNEVLAEAADAFAKMPDGPLKAAAAMALFGRSGVDLIPILNKGSAGLDAMTAQGIKLGTVMSTQQVEAAHKAYLAHQEFNQALSGLANQIGLAVMPAATSLFSYITSTGVPAVEKVTKGIQSFTPELKVVADVFKTIAPLLLVVGTGWALWNVALLATKALQVGQMIVGVAQGLVYLVRTQGLATTAQWLFNVALDANPIGVVILAVTALAAAGIYLYTHWAPFRNFVNGLWSDMRNFGSWISSHFGPAMAALGKLMSDVSHGNLGAIPGDVGSIKNIMGFDTGGIVPGAIGSPHLAIVHGGERVLTPAQQRQGGDMSTTNALLRTLISAVTATPGGQTGVEAALYKANSLSGMHRARGMAGA